MDPRDDDPFMGGPNKATTINLEDFTTMKLIEEIIEFD